jgi:prepilin-type N-terminal cleavage/methylation domain-containing protein
MFKNFHKNKYNKGMTLIELLVVIFIFMVISSITIFSYGKFNSSLSLQNLADDIALSARRAQSYAIGVRGGYDNSFIKGYGIHFSTNTVISNIPAGSNKSFVLFEDMNDDKSYNYDTSGGTCGTPTSTNECLEILNITSSDKISDFYVGIGNEQELHVIEGTIDIIFKRPNPEPTFCVRTDLDQNSSCYGSAVSYVKIRVTNDQNPGVYKTVMISNNGQISVS